MNPYTPYLPTPENQYTMWFDTTGCTDYSNANYFETKLNRLIGEKSLSVGTMKFLSDNGYLDDKGSLNFSDQFTHILSGNVGKGNTFEKVIESVLRDGLVPESMFHDDPHTLADYFNPALITPEMRTMGKKFLTFFNIKVVNKYATLETLKDDLLWLTIAVCPGFSTDPIIKACVLPQGHAVLGFDIEGYDIGNAVSFFDSYPPYKKKTDDRNVYVKWQLSINEVRSKTMKLSIERGDLYIDFDEGKFAWSIPNVPALEGIKKHSALIGKPLAPEVYQDHTGWFVIHGGDLKSIKEFFNIV